MVMFVVETDGSLSNVRVARKVFPSLDAESLVKAALAEILRGVKDDLAQIDPSGMEINILQADCREDAEFVRDEIRKAYPMVGEITITGLGVVIGAHCGPGLLTVFYLCNGRKP